MTPGKIPFIGASDSNNGVTAFIGNESIAEDENVLGVNYDGSVVENFYHPYRCIFSDPVKRFKLKNFAGNKFVYLFLKTTILQQKSKYTYGYKFNGERMKKQQIMLPVNEKGLPDFEYMEKYIALREQILIRQYLEYICPPQFAQILPLNKKIWKPFFIEEIFEIVSGRDIYEDERISGETPYIGASANNNGVCHFISNENETLEKNCISVNRNGSVGYAFYHPYAALYSNDCRKLRPRNFDSKYISMFLANQITAQKDKYNYGYKMGTGRLKKQQIMLPINELGLPDFEYMEAYSRNQFAQILKKYLDVVQ